jgi:LmbE family N-acetylglucosaminyl deacetylase
VGRTRADTSAFAGRTILAVLAHPDDESLACGGTLARLADLGAHTVLICASRGERGFVSEPALVDSGELGRVRALELTAAARILGVSEVVALDHPDGNLRWADVPEFHEQIVAAIRRHKPDAVITFDEDGLYWHLDHIGVHERTSTAVLSLGDAAPPLYYVTMPRGMMRQIVDAATSRGWQAPKSGFWGIVPDAFGLETEPPSFCVDIGPWVTRKMAALQCHRTQMGSANPFTMISEEEARRWLGVEFFRRASNAGTSHVLEQLAGRMVGR